MFENLPILSMLIWTPVIASLLVLKCDPEKHGECARFFALISAVLTIIISIPLYTQFDFQTPMMQFQEYKDWIGAYNIHYHLGVDGISIPLILLTNFMTLLVILASWKSVRKKVPQYLAAFLIMQASMIGVFTALDTMLFFVFWEATLIPMFLIIGIWGSENRLYAAIKFFLYTFLGSALMFIAFLYLHAKTGSFALDTFYAYKMGMFPQTLIFLAFFLAFAVKIPMWPMHTWLPDAHTEAPAGGSVILAAITLKMGGYGFLRFALPITPDACAALSWFVIALSLVAVVYIGLVAIAQKDMKRLIAYSSIAHMGLVTLGAFIIFSIFRLTGTPDNASLGVEGAIIQMISHGFVSAAMFLTVGALYDRMHSRMIHDFGGIVNTMPLLATFFMLFALANAGLPGTSGFVGEFMVILSAFKASFWIALLAATTLILAPAYTLWMYKRVFFGDVANESVGALEDIAGVELLVFVLLGAAIVWLGVYPQATLNVMHSSVDHLVSLAQISKL